MTVACPQYIEICTDFLYTHTREINFDLFVFSEKNKKERPVLLAGRSTSTAEVRDILETRKFKALYIRKDAIPSLHDFIEKSIDEIICNRDLPIFKRSKIVYNCATKILQDVFDDPRSGANLRRTKDITNSIVDLILQDDSSLKCLLQLGSRDYYTFTHCINVCVFAVGLRVVVGKTAEAALRDFAHGCILHDIGKSEIPVEILKKPGRLSPDEFAVIKRHPVIGASLLKEILPEDALDVVLHHHEQYRGNGYPEGLRENEISDNAKIATIADVYDALTTKRPYADARPPFKAVMMMKEKMVGHFEQEKFIQFIKLLGGRK